MYPPGFLGWICNFGLSAIWPKTSEVNALLQGIQEAQNGAEGAVLFTHPAKRSNAQYRVLHQGQQRL